MSIPSFECGVASRKRRGRGWGFHSTLDVLKMTVPEIDPIRVGEMGCFQTRQRSPRRGTG
jgi:hypothetical protein